MSINYIVNSNVNPIKSYSFKATFGDLENMPENDIFYPINSEGETNNNIKIGIHTNMLSETIDINDDVYEEIFNSVAAYLMISFVYNNESLLMKFHKEHAHIANNGICNIDFAPPLNNGAVNNNASHFNLYKNNGIYYLSFTICYKGLNAIDYVINNNTFDITIKYI